MRIVIPTNSGADLDAPCSPIFGRSPTFVFVDTETLEFKAVPNPAVGAMGGAGVQAAQFVLQQGAEAVISNNLGPNAFRVIQAAGVPMYQTSGTTVRDAVAAFNAGELTVLASPGASHVAGPHRRGRGR